MKIGIVGAGFVGSTIAYAALLRKAATEIVLIDIDKKRSSAEADDISHAVPFSHPMGVYDGEYEHLQDSGIVIITAGVNQKPGESRLQLLDRNAKILKEIIPSILQHAPDALVLVTTNPVDAMTHLAARFARDMGFSHDRIIGSGTTLDTARFRSLLSTPLGVNPQHVHGYVVGEHGDSEVLTWSIVDIGGLPLDRFIRHRNLHFGKQEQQEIDRQVRYAAYSIIEGKGATYYGIGAAVAHMIDVIAHNERSILTVCRPLPEIAGIKDVTVSIPHLFSGREVVASLPLQLDDAEEKALQASASAIKASIRQYDDQFNR
ncbi:MAG: L-lactate dehydrogenase [Caldithrix sp.]|nr:L-lactate dehydrogenase [Caldithrix sp.]